MIFTVTDDSDSKRELRVEPKERRIEISIGVERIVLAHDNARALSIVLADLAYDLLKVRT